MIAQFRQLSISTLDLSPCPNISIFLCTTTIPRKLDFFLVTIRMCRTCYYYLIRNQIIGKTSVQAAQRQASGEDGEI